MDIATVTQLIGSLGFPVAMCVALFWKINKQDETHKCEIDTMRTALEQNTVVLTKLCEKLSGGEK